MEFGGCLPLEPLSSKNDPFRNIPKLQLNSGRSAMLVATRICGAKKVYLPYYLCPTVKQFFLGRGYVVQEYNIDQRFLPVEIRLKKEEMLVWTNYYGCMPEEIINSAVNMYGEQLIIDNTQAFFCEPREKAWNVYSCRKFVGVPEGAYLVHAGLDQKEWTDNIDGWKYLQTAALNSSNIAYGEYLKNDSRFDRGIQSMSYLTRQYLNAVDYRQVKNQREKNFEVLHSRLATYNELTEAPILWNGGSALVYPFMKKGNEVIRKSLLQRRIYTPTWWKHMLMSKETTPTEKRFARTIIPLPIDQRYTEIEMEHLADIVIQELDAHCEREMVKVD